MSSLAPLLSGSMAVWEVHVEARDVVFVKGIFEASEGVGAVFAPPRPRGARRDGGRLTIAAPLGMAAEVHRVLADLKEELGDRMHFLYAPVPEISTGSGTTMRPDRDGCEGIDDLLA